MGSQLNIFTIYTSKDKEAIAPVLDHLKSLEQEYKLTIWHDDPILEGQQWKPQVASRLQETEIFLLLLSSTFMYSEFVKQLEFKMLIDSYKAGESTVIPILLEDCPWDTEFLSDDYKFSFNELQVLPEQRKPIKKWGSEVEAYNSIIASLDIIISKKTGIPIVQEVEKAMPETTIIEDQIALSFDEAQAEEEKAVIKNEEERKTEEEQRLLRESKKNRLVAQDEKRKSEAEAKQKLEEQRLKEATEAKRIAQQDTARRIAEDEKKLARELEAKSIVQEEQKAVEEKDAKRVQAVAVVKQKERKNRQAVETNEKAEKQPQQAEKSGINKKILIGAIIALLAFIAIWAFSSSNENPKKPIPVVNNTPEVVISKIEPSEEVNIDSDKKVASMPKLAIGDQFGGGMIFSMDSSNNSGIIVHIDDAGPMPWQSANKIHEQLGEGWRLPTLKELQLMRKTLGQGSTNRAEFSDGLYWSSTAFEEHQARLLRFRDGNTSYHYNRNIETRKYRVRAVKDFSR